VGGFYSLAENDTGKVEIEALVRKGYLVRTRSDADTMEGRTNDTRRRDQVLASGAQLISTNYPAFEPASWTGYSVALPDGLPAPLQPNRRPTGLHPCGSGSASRLLRQPRLASVAG
jgi:hypothetical protein